MPNESKSVYVTLHKNFVREGIPYTDRETGEQRTFNSATMPRGTSIDGRDVSFFEFSPLYVNESRKGEDYRDIPLLKGREVWLSRRAGAGRRWRQGARDGQGHAGAGSLRLGPAAAGLPRLLEAAKPPRPGRCGHPQRARPRAG